MISADELRAAIREGRITQDEERRLLQVLAEIAFRLWYEQSPPPASAPRDEDPLFAPPVRAGNFHQFEVVKGNRYCGRCGGGEFHPVHDTTGMKSPPPASTRIG